MSIMVKNMKNKKHVVEGGFANSVFVESDSDADVNESIENNMTWWPHLKNVFDAVWPLFLYAGLVLVLLLYAWLIN